VLVNKIHFRQKMQQMICTVLHFVRSFLGIWRIERYVCFWALWFSKPTISSTVITFSSVHACFSLVIWCLWLHVSQISVNDILTLFLLQFIFKNSASILRTLYFLNQCKFLIKALFPLLNGTLHHWYVVSALKIIIYGSPAFVYKHQKCM